jgi:hypothetical protein
MEYRQREEPERRERRASYGTPRLATASATPFAREAALDGGDKKPRSFRSGAMEVN